jgi:hypothetical protein
MKLVSFKKYGVGRKVEEKGELVIENVEIMERTAKAKAFQNYGIIIKKTKNYFI